MMEETIEHVPVEGVDLRQIVEKTGEKNATNPVVQRLAPEEAPVPKLKEVPYRDPVNADYKRHMNNLISSPEWKTDGAETIRLFHQTIHLTGECLTK